MASAWLSLRIQQGGATISNSFCCGTPEEKLGDIVGREVRKISDSSSVSEVQTKDGISCSLNIPFIKYSDGKRDAGHGGVSRLRLPFFSSTWLSL